jgi:hypothetical protein
MFIFVALRNEVRWCSNLAPGNTPAAVCERIYKKVSAGAEATFAFSPASNLPVYFCMHREMSRW